MFDSKSAKVGRADELSSEGLCPMSTLGCAYQFIVSKR